MKKTCNVVMLPSKEQTYQVKEGDWFIDYPPYDWGKLEYLKCERVTSHGHAWNGTGIQTYINNLYITSDDEIKAGDWCYDAFDEMDNKPKVYQATKVVQNNKEQLEYPIYKIVATTDTSIMHLSNNGRVGYPLPNIPESFIKAFVESNGTIKKVELEMEQYFDECPDIKDVRSNIKIKTTPDNTVIVHQSKMYSKDEVEKLCELAFNKGWKINESPITEFQKWSKDNL
jgi:hypothetical protein